MFLLRCGVATGHQSARPTWAGAASLFTDAGLIGSLDLSSSGGHLVEKPQQLVRGALNLSMPPFGGAVLAGQQAAAMDAPEVSVDERMPRLRLVRCSFGEGEMPLPVLTPRVLFQVRVLVGGARLCLAPVAAEDILSRSDEPPRPLDGASVDRIRGDRGLSRTARGTGTRSRRGWDMTAPLAGGRPRTARARCLRPAVCGVRLSLPAAQVPEVRLTARADG